MNSQFLALGTAQFGLDYGVANRHGKPNKAEISEILEIAHNEGIKIIDTAISYGNSEEVLGEIGVEGFKVITKIPPVSHTNKNRVCTWMLEQISCSLERLRQDSIYAVLLHSPSDMSGELSEEIKNGLNILKQKNLVQKIGVSIYRPKDLILNRKLISSGVVQAPISIMDRRFLEKSTLNNIADSDCELIARSAFLQGLLLMNPDELDERFSRWQPLFRSFSEWCRKLRVTRLSACLALFNHFSGISRVVLGVETPRQLQEILHAWEDSQSIPLYDCFTDDEDLLLPMNWQPIQSN